MKNNLCPPFKSTALSPYFVYLLRCNDGTLYTGTARNVLNRLAVHNAGKGAKYTRGRLPVTLAYTEFCAGKGDALRRELAIKALPRQQKEHLLESRAALDAGLSFPAKLTLSDFVAMEALEGRCYDPAHIAPASAAYEWYLYYPSSTTAAFFQGTLIGFVNLFPVVERVFAGLESGVFDDSALQKEEIAPALPKEPLRLFLSCIAVDSAFRGTGLAMELFFRALSNYNPCLPNLRALITDNVTEAGERFSARLGLQKLCDSAHGSVIRGRYFDSMQA